MLTLIEQSSWSRENYRSSKLELRHRIDPRHLYPGHEGNPFLRRETAKEARYFLLRETIHGVDEVDCHLRGSRRSFAGVHFHVDCITQHVSIL